MRVCRIHWCRIDVSFRCSATSRPARLAPRSRGRGGAGQEQPGRSEFNLLRSRGDVCGDEVVSIDFSCGKLGRYAPLIEDSVFRSSRCRANVYVVTRQ